MTDNIKKSLKERCTLKNVFPKMVRGKLTMIKFWKSLENVLRKFSKLERTILSK